ncbi:MAG TPA: Txe/YoeB family addiction module toxin [Chthoniobacterales bacterium]
MRSAYSGSGKPEPLKHTLQEYWSRRINSEHRIVYRKSGGQILIHNCDTITELRWRRGSHSARLSCFAVEVAAAVAPPNFFISSSSLAM